MKKDSTFLIALGSGLAAFGFSGWRATGHPAFTVTQATGSDWDFSAGWPLHSQLEFTIGIVLLVCGVILRSYSK
jgi:hypothetical protein